MAGRQGYDVIVGIPMLKPSIPAMVTAFIVFIFLVRLPASAQAQAHGIPASVTSLGFGGRGARPSGISPSVTSVGPGFAGGSAWALRSGATFSWGTSRRFADNSRRNFYRRRDRSYYSYYPYGAYAYGGYYGAPFYYPYVGYDSLDVGTYDDDQPDDRYEGGPT
ncbi:MAG: hypothetical protein JOY93_12970, partial [Acidobacteriales bacterium]|nr:hypothetical protein [Terriglobales bacterium]